MSVGEAKRRCRQSMGRASRSLSSILLALMILAPGTLAQDREAIVELPVTWKIGDNYLLERIKVRKQYKGASLQLSGGARTLIDVEVVRKRRDGYVICWTYGKTELLGARVGVAPLVDELSKLVENMRVDLRTDAYGSVVGLENRDEVVSQYRLMIDRFSQVMDRKDPSGAKSANLRAFMARFMNPATVEAFALNEPALFYAASGGAYPLGKPLTYEDSLPNPLGGRPFPSKAQFLLREVDLARNRAVIEWRQTIDPRHATAVLRQTLSAIAERMGRPLPDTLKWPQIRIEDLASYQFDTVTGWPLSIGHTRTSVIGLRRRVDRLTIRVVSGR